MKFTNNQFIFEPSDVSARTSLEQAGIAAQCSEGQTPEQWLTQVIENQIGVAAASYLNEQLLTFTDLGKAIVSATPEQQSQIQPLIEQAQTILGVNNDNG